MTSTSQPMALSSRLVFDRVRTTPLTWGSHASVTSRIFCARGRVSAAPLALAACAGGGWASVLTGRVLARGSLRRKGAAAPACPKGWRRACSRAMPVNLAPALEILRREVPDLVAVYAFGSVAN